MEECPS